MHKNNNRDICNNNKILPFDSISIPHPVAFEILISVNGIGLIVESVEDNQAPAASVGGATGGTLPAASNVPGGGASSSSGGSMTSLRASGSASGSVGSGSGSVTVEDEDTDDEDYDEDESDDDTIEDGDDDDEPFNVLCSKQITLMEKSQPQAQYQVCAHCYFSETKSSKHL